MILDSFALIALFSLAPFPEDMLHFVNLFDFSLPSVSALCASFSFYLYLLKPP